VIGAHPDVSNEVLDLTEAFNEARYTIHPIENESIPTLRKKWDRVRKDLENQDPPDAA
jgi:hypothetical protein